MKLEWEARPRISEEEGKRCERKLKMDQRRRICVLRWKWLEDEIFAEKSFEIGSIFKIWRRDGMGQTWMISAVGLDRHCPRKCTSVYRGYDSDRSIRARVKRDGYPW